MLDFNIIWCQFATLTMPTTWEQWSFIGTIVGATANTAFLIALIYQIVQGRNTLRESRRSARAAQRSVREAMRARIDEQAPRVIPILEKPMVHGLRDGNSFSAEADPEYVLPRMKDARLLFIVTGKLVNEGKGSARVSLNGNGACFITDDDEALFLGEISSSNEQRILSSGESVRFAWSDGHSLQDWVDAYQNPSPPNPHGACFMEVIIRDYLKDGVLDHIHLEMTGRPVVPVEGDEGRWEYGKEDSIVAISYPIHRTYLQEGWKGLTPPWEETYKEWNDQQTTGREEPEVSAKRWHMILSAINRLLTGR